MDWLNGATRIQSLRNELLCNKESLPNTLLFIAAWGCIVHKHQVDDKNVVNC